MTSKNLFFNMMKEDFKRRLWTVALISLFFFFTFPVRVTMMISDYANDMELITLGYRDSTVEVIRNQLLSSFSDWMSVENGLVATFIVIFSVLCGVTGFSYLHSRKKTDFFHSIPIKREKLFAASFINGILYTAVPYLVSLLLAVVVVQIKVGIVLPWAGILGAYLFHMVFYILMYTVAVLAVILTGNTIVSLLGMMVFCSWGPALTGIIMAYCEEYFKTHYMNDDLMTQFMTKSSPVAWYVYSLSTEITAVKVLSTLTAAAVICVLAVILYRLRPSESAGKAMAFKKSEPIIKILIVVPTALFLSLFFRQMRSNGEGWSIFGLICGLVITYCIIEIIYNFDFRRLFSHKIHLIFCGVLSLAILAFFRFDLSGYDVYLPAKDKVESSAIYSYDLDGDALYDYGGVPKLIQQSSGNHYLSINSSSEIDFLKEMQLDNTEDVLVLAQAGINSNRISNAENDWVDQSQHDWTVYTSLIVKYHLKSGRDVYRSYRIPLQEVEKQLEAIYNTAEYKKMIYPMLRAEDLSDYSGVNYEEYEDYRHVNFTDEAMKTKLIATYQEELSALSYAKRKTESPIATLQFKTKDLQSMIDILRKEGNGYNMLNEWGYYPLYPSFVKTIALLEECQIAPGTYLNSENVENIELIREETVIPDTYNSDKPEAIAELVDDVQGRKIVIVTDKKQIEEILDTCVFAEYANMNQLNELEWEINVTAATKMEPKNNSNAEFEYFGKEEETYSSDYQTFRLYFDKDKIPEFVEKQLIEG